jgi:hypothetical protein
MKPIHKMLSPLTESNIFYLLFIYSAISEEEEVSMSQSSDSDHEEEHEDTLDKKQTSFNKHNI